LEKQLASKLLEYFVTKNASGEEATVLYYFLVKVVGCPQCGKDIDLFKTRIFSRNAMPQSTLYRSKSRTIKALRGNGEIFGNQAEATDRSLVRLT
jgi:hypothetical protein